MGVGEARSGLRLELVAGQVLGLERERGLEVTRQVVVRLAGNPVDQVEREVVEAGFAERRDGGAHLRGARAALEHLEQVRLEALRPERDAVDAVLAEERCELRRDGLGVCLDGHLSGGGKRGEEVRERGGLGEGRRAAAEEDRLQIVREQIALECELHEKRLDVRSVLVLLAYRRDEVAVTATVGAERQVHVEVLSRGAGSDFTVPLLDRRPGTSRPGPAPHWGARRPPSGTVCGEPSRGCDAFVPIS